MSLAACEHCGHLIEGTSAVCGCFGAVAARSRLADLARKADETTSIDEIRAFYDAVDPGVILSLVEQVEALTRDYERLHECHAHTQGNMEEHLKTIARAEQAEAQVKALTATVDACAESGIEWAKRAEKAERERDEANAILQAFIRRVREIGDEGITEDNALAIAARLHDAWTTANDADSLAALREHDLALAEKAVRYMLRLRYPTGPIDDATVRPLAQKAVE